MFLSFAAEISSDLLLQREGERTAEEKQQGEREKAMFFMSMGLVKHDQAAIFRRKMSELRMFSSILEVRSTEKSKEGSFVG